MSTVKVTITLGADELARIRALVEQGQVANVSVFVQHAVRRSLDDVAGWAGVLAAALEGTGGPLTPEEVQWADEVLAGGGEPFDPKGQPGHGQGAA
jgi:Arc/MetJ-type ribon-helix-helix transcriptional regulator